MVSKAKLKYIKSLQIKKFRKLNREFLVEGAKSILELLKSDFLISSLYVTKGFEGKYSHSLTSFRGEITEVTEEELTSMGSLESNNAALAIVKMKENSPLLPEKNEYLIVLDGIKDPGNMGTIIRIADWYGIEKIICSNECSDFYNPKVINSTMGSFARVSLFYTDLKEYLSSQNLPVLGAVLDGKAVSEVSFPNHGFLLMGSESNGISLSLQSYITQKITIPRLGSAESLNVSVATGIICDRIFNK